MLSFQIAWVGADANAASQYVVSASKRRVLHGIDHKRWSVVTEERQGIHQLEGFQRLAARPTPTPLMLGRISRLTTLGEFTKPMATSI